MTTSFKARHQIEENKITYRGVEAIPKLKDEIADDIPTYVRLEWKHRASWTGNKCLWTIYRLIKTFFVSVWFYFIPFVALGLNVFVPYMLEPENTNASDGSSMGDEYEEYLVGILTQVENDYTEPSVQEMIDLMNEIPFEMDGDTVYKQDMDVLVTPLTLD